MKTTIILTTEDQKKLRSILKLEAPGPKPTQEQQISLRKIVSKAIEPSFGNEAESWIGFGDQISLVSPKDSSDYFNLRIVMPGEADPDAELISVLFPVSLAAIGRRCGENVSWETPRGMREMRIIAISKAEEMLA